MEEVAPSEKQARQRRSCVHKACYQTVTRTRSRKRRIALAKIKTQVVLPNRLATLDQLMTLSLLLEAEPQTLFQMALDLPLFQQLSQLRQDLSMAFDIDPIPRLRLQELPHKGQALGHELASVHETQILGLHDTADPTKRRTNRRRRLQIRRRRVRNEHILDRRHLQPQASILLHDIP